MPKVNPEIVRWARENAGLTLEDAARAIGLTGANAAERLEEMETGVRDPTRPQLLKMADRYRRPLLAFYLPAPPAAGEQTHDYRTLPRREAGSEAIVEALVRNVKARQTLVRDALEDAEEDTLLPFVSSVRPSQGPEVLARAMTDVLRFDRVAYRATRTTDDAFRYLRESVEEAGAYVLLMGNLGHHTTNLSPSVFRGMALADPVAPFIVINENDSRSAWAFTLLHELAHIFIGESGISGYDGDQAIERLCDDAAARFLLDRGELQEIVVRDVQLDDLVAQIGAFANTRKVSRKMIAYNMMRSGITDPATYRRLADTFDRDRLEYANRAPTRSGGPDYYVIRRHRVGRGLIKLVDRMVAGGELTSTRAGKVLGVNPTAVGRMIERVS